jgi:hypothetical protein
MKRNCRVCGKKVGPDTSQLQCRMCREHIVTPKEELLTKRDIEKLMGANAYKRSHGRMKQTRFNN